MISLYSSAEMAAGLEVLLVLESMAVVTVLYYYCCYRKYVAYTISNPTLGEPLRLSTEGVSMVLT